MTLNICAVLKKVHFPLLYLRFVETPSRDWHVPPTPGIPTPLVAPSSLTPLQLNTCYGNETCWVVVTCLVNHPNKCGFVSLFKMTDCAYLIRKSHFEVT
jgi:hypothetical protein